METLKLGSNYGSKYIVNSKKLVESFMISGGCGEDISFDIEFASKFNANVIMVDPIPRSIEHVNNVLLRIGTSSNESYSTTGCQPVSAYDLRNIKSNQLVFIPKALWNTKTKLTLFPPVNEEHISFSFLNLQDTEKSRNSIEAETTTITELAEMISPARITVLKLDIEGAQLEVIRDCFQNGIFPHQIIVEIDELFFPSLNGRRRAKELLKLLRQHGYKPVAAHEKFDITFIKMDQFKTKGSLHL